MVNSDDSLLAADYDIIRSGLVELYNGHNLYARLVEGKGFVGNTGNIRETMPEIGYYPNIDLLIQELHGMVDIRQRYTTLDSCLASTEFQSNFNSKLISSKSVE